MRNAETPDSRPSRPTSAHLVGLVVALTVVAASVIVLRRPELPSSVWVDEHSVRPRGPDRSDPLSGSIVLCSLFSPYACTRPGGAELADVRTSPWFGDHGDLVAVVSDTNVDACLKAISIRLARTLRPATVYVQTNEYVEIDGLRWTRCDKIDDARVAERGGSSR